MSFRATAEQQAAIDARDSHVFLHAGAGSGKTAVLVARFCEAVCRDGVGVDEVLAITFTDKAAGELKRRIREELANRAEAAERAGDPSGARLLRLQARQAASAWISTIHGLCQRLLAAHPLAVGLDPRFRVLGESEARRLRSTAFELALDDLLSGSDPEKLLMVATYGPFRLEGMAASAFDELRSRGRDDPRLDELPRPSPVGLLGELGELARPALEEIDGLSGADAEDRRERLQDAIALAERLGPDALPSEGELDRCRATSTAKRFAGPAIAAYERAHGVLATRKAEIESAHHYGYLRELLEHYGRRYQALKRDRSALDFEDLQLGARQLLRSRPDIAGRYHARFRHLLVDELQDTNRLQLDVIDALRGERSVVFCVGDRFQAIYGFRHADVEVFRARERQAETDPRAAALPLRGNFRSRPEIVATANAIGNALLEDFAELTVARALESGEEDPPVEVLLTESEGWEDAEIDLDVSEDERAQPFRVAEARFLARRLSELADSGAAKPSEMVVLLRSFTYVETFEDALSRGGLEPYVVGGRGYWSQQQVADVCSMLRALANPRDEVGLLGALASPFCGVSPDALWLLRKMAGEGGILWQALRRLGEGEGAGDPWASLVPEQDRARLREFLQAFGELRETAPRLSLEALIDRAITRFGYDLALLSRPRGRQRMANVRKLMRQAREFESREGRDLRDFLEWIASEEELAIREGEAPLQAEEHGGVRVMTVHAAKGLQFPVVAIADLGRRLHFDYSPALRLRPHAQEGHEVGAAMRMGMRLARLGAPNVKAFDYEELMDEALAAECMEERRLLYVAATRAQERLILSGAYPISRPPERLHDLAPLMHRLVPGLGVPLDGQTPLRLPAASDADGQLVGGDVSIAVSLNAEPSPEVAANLRAVYQGNGNELAPLPDHLPELAPPPAADAAAVRHLSYSAISEYGRCGYRFYLQRVLGMGAADDLRASSAEVGSIDDQDLEALEHRYARGRVVHELLEWSCVNGWLPPPPERCRELLRAEGVPGSKPEVERAIALVEAWTGSKLCAELRRNATRLRAEVPFVFPMRGLVVRGEMDLLAELPGELLVLDYKTDRLGDSGVEGHMARYEIQRKLYAYAALLSGALRVRTVYAFLERVTDPVELVFGQDDREVLHAELEGLVEGIAAGRFEVTASPNRALCFDCPARARLCSHPQSATLAA